MLASVFWYALVFGGTVLCLQFILALVGVGVDADDIGDAGDTVDADVGADAGDTGDLDAVDSDANAPNAAHTVQGHGHDPLAHSRVAANLFKMLSFRTLVAGVTFFGLGGLLGLSNGINPGVSLGIACLFGTVAIFGVYYLYRMLFKLQSDGNLKTSSLKWATGQVYLKIPGDGAGQGKVQVTHQDRTMEYDATTVGPELPAGTPVVVIRVLSEHLVEVQRKS